MSTRSADKYQSLHDLQESLTKLFDVLEYHPQKVSLKVPTKFQRLIDQYANGGYDREFVNDLREQIDAAIKLADDKRLDMWSYAETARDCRAQLEDCEKLLSEKREEIERLRKELDRVSEKAASAQAPIIKDEEPQSSLKDAITEIIALRDRQILKLDYLESMGESKDSPAYRIIDSTLRETAQMLKNWDVDILDGIGEFVPYEQTAVDVRETSEDGLVGTVAAVVRPGYRYGGEMLRAAEVIVYTKKA